MMKRKWLSRVLLSTGLVALTAGSASAQQVFQVSRKDSRNAIGFTIGGFFLRGEDSRPDNDVLIRDLDELAFRVKDFNNVTFGGEYLFGVTDFLEGGVGISYYQRSVPSVYRDLVNDDGSEIAQELKLRVLPITATIRFLPLGRGAAVEPYVGAGVGFLNWQYTESGDFVDFTDNTVFSNRYKANGTAVGPVVLGGIRVPVGDAMLIGGEIRWQKGEGDTGGINEGFLGDEIDLSGLTTNFTIHFRF
jgi:hypothetical protein